MQGFVIVFISAFAFFVLAVIYGYLLNPGRGYSRWVNTVNYYGVVDVRSFVRVAYIHNASYFGGLVGLMITFYLIKPLK